ncbi:hypothetical protein MHI43_08845 [Paenibacillus sp. FSL H8-0457]|uniref:hypothetical protein n=1 Tax=Paenibacillus TaxID=44249 RepID=UPI0003E1DBB8|nr:MULTISPECIES: hypothetical protein [Paenibacillus]ETT57381.1 hypothetical protein C172_30808 [Paenibacillus sp. FSL H8-457]QOT07807.1 hypothetical protein JNUCC32_16575 [Paenibacillus sp. JNUCC-32]WFB60411.1 hypothetical protein P0X86_09450 [Paenibacillus sp. BR1-192]GIP01797.1 hypothetical protein J28TS4_02040 [Paenibacillus lautus]
MSWLIENFYIVAVIGFFIISALGKRGKNAEDGKNPRMPSFGGEGDRPARPGQQRPQRPEARRVQTAPQVSRPAPVQESPRIDRIDEEEADTGNGYSLEHQEIDRMKRRLEMSSSHDSMDHRIEMMQRDLDRIHSHLNRMTLDIPETVVEIHDEDQEQGKNGRSVLAEQARNGIVWAEILGPPRAKRSMNPRR